MKRLHYLPEHNQEYNYCYKCGCLLLSKTVYVCDELEWFKNDMNCSIKNDVVRRLNLKLPEKVKQ